MKYPSLVLTLTLLLGVACKKKTIEDPFPEKTNANLTWFGYTLVDVYWDDPNDGEDKINYIDEVAPFSNIADLLVVEPTDNIVDRLNVMETHQVKGLIHLNEIFFEQVGTTTEFSGVDYDLRSDYMDRWDTFVSTNNFDSDISDLAGFYLGEEPTWNSISSEDFELACNYIKATVPDVPILMIEAYPAVKDMVIPDAVDWVGFDHYFIADPGTNATFQSELADLKSKKAEHQDIMLILDAHYIPFAHGSSGIGINDMDVVARNYYNLANSESEVIGMIGYHWPGGFEFSSATGARHFPDHVLSEHKEIGRAITGK